MADAPTPGTNPEDDSIAKVKAALEAEREAHKRTKAAYLTPIRSALGLGDDATFDSITATLGARLGEVDGQIAECVKDLTAERDAAVATAAKIEGERAVERIDAAISAALGRCGVMPQCKEDAATILRGVLEVKDSQVVTKAAPNTVPGMNVDQFIVGQLRGMRPHYFQKSVGGGGRCFGSLPDRGPDASCFRTGNVTAMMTYISTYGEHSALEACRRENIAPPKWLTTGGPR